METAQIQVSNPGVNAARRIDIKPRTLHRPGLLYCVAAYAHSCLTHDDGEQYLCGSGQPLHKIDPEQHCSPVGVGRGTPLNNAPGGHRRREPWGFAVRCEYGLCVLNAADRLCDGADAHCQRVPPDKGGTLAPGTSDPCQTEHIEPQTDNQKHSL